jgi:signal transduction histidine kinase
MNAVKYAPEGSRVRLTAGVRSGKPPQVAIIVSDNGTGIDADKLETIFEPFVQLGTRRSSQECVGLGLAISRDLARGMGGDLAATSTVDVGSAFTLALPRAQVR